MLQRCAAVLAAAGLVVTVACSQTDAGITTSVKTKLAADDNVKAYQVDVDTRNGVVTLSGAVETATAKEQAIRITRETDGVRDVIDQIRVGEAAATFGSEVERRTESGAAELKEEGRELKQEGREAAGEVREAGREAADWAGNAADKTGAAVTDAAITTAVKSKFLADTTVKGLQIDVDTDGGTVTLNGTVSSRAEANRAMMLARDTAGVKRVVDNMRVGR
jgi:osmotically-inducible protein OsmY